MPPAQAWQSTALSKSGTGGATVAPRHRSNSAESLLCFHMFPLYRNVF